MFPAEGAKPKSVPLTNNEKVPDVSLPNETASKRTTSLAETVPISAMVVVLAKGEQELIFTRDREGINVGPAQPDIRTIEKKLQTEFRRS